MRYSLRNFSPSSSSNAAQPIYNCRITHVRQGERVVVWRERPYQHGYPAEDLAWYGAAYGVEAGPTRLETMRRLVLHLAAQEALVLEQPEKERVPHARTARPPD